ncbi:hypothetical protein K2173_004724 [Erythroxylum novogranatense]|uniref:Glycosyl hydrolase family 13 catalytic domain-containing protein n=1 Tax=Erythroxylum novogranatense TaxID=1862640 RepID=A0AAV8U876_9ROSI|nr:hypothetical protein K2173_004724 [Erythroxylum novogranatense]
MATPPSLLAIRPCSYNCIAMDSSKLTLARHYVLGSRVIIDLGSNDLQKKLLLRDVRNATKNQRQCLNSRICATSRISVHQTEQVTSTISEVGKQKKVSAFLFRTEKGDPVKVSVRKKNMKYAVYVEVSSVELDASDSSLILTWGIYRSDSSCFMPLDSKQSVSEVRSMDTPLIRHSSNKFVVELEFEAKQTPFYLSFILKSMLNTELIGSEIRSHRRENFCVPVGFDRGNPIPLGLSFSVDGSMNFAFFSRHAERVVLCLYGDSMTDASALELDLDPYVNRTGDVWHASLEGAWNFVNYGYRLKESTLQGNTENTDAELVVLDPYAKVILNVSADHRSSVSPKYLGRLCKEPTFDWSGDVRPNLAMEKLIVYRLNVMRFTKHKSSQLYSDIAGTFAGLSEKLSHFKSLGVNAVLLEPIFPFDEKQGPYYPCHFFSPANLYGPSGGSMSAINSMKEMVKKLHANGIEVLLEVVFTHTAESGALQGIDDLSYYFASRVDKIESRNALNCNYPVVQSLILDSLRYWVTEFRIDGFCFINASSLLTGCGGEFLSRPPLIEAISFDPLLSKTKIIADCWDPRDRLPKETCFPHWKRWSEINTKFCHDVRKFLRGEGLLSDLATRLCGSGDIFSSGRGPGFSFNFIARNFGLPLVDLVSFSDGELASELSWNCGEEGPTKETFVLERRLKQIRNYLFVLYVSLGVPVLNMGDECGQSSGGSTSHTSRKSFDWSALSTSFCIQTTEYISFLSSLRVRRSDLLQKRDFLKEEKINWSGSDQSPPKWEDPSCKFLALTLKADEAEEQPSSSESFRPKGDLFIAINASGRSEIVVLPPCPEAMEWRRLVDTALPYPGFFTDGGVPVVEQMTGLYTYEMKSYSCTLFEASSSDH